MNNAFIDNSRANFSHLMYRMPDQIQQTKYVNKWRQRYVKSFNEAGPKSGFIWAIRVHKSLKEVFTSASFYEESLIAKESNCWASFFYLSYYSLFHALMSCVCCIPEESIESLAEISHKKLMNVFQSNFVNPKPSIVLEDICALFPMLKYMREYYSYKMPPNDFLYEDKNNIKPDQAIPYFIRNCIQLANLHSELIYEVARKHCGKLEDRGECYGEVVEWYSLLNCPKHPSNDSYLLDYTDRVKIEEIFKCREPVPFMIDFEHFTDEFRCYNGSKPPIYRDGRPITTANFVCRTIFR